jgi:hypothetical protein
MRRGGWLAPILMASLVRAAPTPSTSRGMLTWAIWSNPCVSSISQRNEGGCLPSIIKIFRHRFPSIHKAAMCSSSTAKDDGKDADVGHINSMQTLDSKVYVPKGPRLYVPTFDIDTHVAEAWKHWEDIGKPKFVCAPMVDQSELSFRMMVSSSVEWNCASQLSSFTHVHACGLGWHWTIYMRCGFCST